MKHMSYAAALAEAVHQAMANDERVSLIAGHLLGLGPHAALMQQIYDDFPDRIFDPPNAEAALAGLGAGAAMAGGRPIVNLGTANFAYLALSQIINDAATTRHMTNGALGAPVVYFALQGVRGAGAAQHSGSPQAMLWNCPGLRIALPATPADAKGLMAAALSQTSVQLPLRGPSGHSRWATPDLARSIWAFLPPINQAVCSARSGM